MIASNDILFCKGYSDGGMDRAGSSFGRAKGLFGSVGRAGASVDRSARSGASIGFYVRAVREAAPPEHTQGVRGPAPPAYISGSGRMVKRKGRGGGGEGSGVR